MDMFQFAQDNFRKSNAPLADRMRPTTLDEFVGQKHILGHDKLLYRAIKADKVRSLIFYGPPGTGKTTLANIIANTTKSSFEKLNAVTSGVTDIKKIVNESKDRLSMYGKRTILFVDEIHRFNKSQQDALLPYVEDGTIILIGATTENPYFEVIRPLVSRSMIFELYPLSDDDIREIVLRALNDEKRGLGNEKIKVTDDALNHIIAYSDGDARTALNAIELAFLTTERDENGVINIDIEVAQECIQRKVLKYDKNGDNHYDTISAFIKSMRGSDPDAALYWLAKMIYAGEDPMFIARRIVICAAEDVGNADPNALNIAVSAMQAVNQIGMPEGRIILAQAAIYVACAPKSNSAIMGIDSALDDIKHLKTGAVPMHLQDAHYKDAKNLNRGVGYKYAHDFKNHYVKQQYLPDELIGKRYYNPSSMGFEKKISEWLKFIKDSGDS
ncbi:MULTISPECIES: replication-associated recombination protein A [Thermoanaerobacterium]|uniref:Replication-associated recombination protein A n=1 Tax=Thermoanaerobacterium xylanolyticum (strain ATCC 49914 / DSM 7097 / LX-11) TaxID=858215 RepID=F6BGM2_THEXL|nr:replication-associated recombination protein A [Thermoanaerobacterium xylanolyticum]AEF17484.1 AAA ATPase central domain protein [Thermoanaerobacterium xylanolyticum LX-11]